MEKPKRFALKIGLVWGALILLFPLGLVLLYFYIAKPLIGRKKIVVSEKAPPGDMDEAT